jgi:3'-5' exoribonuclease 1
MANTRRLLKAFYKTEEPDEESMARSAEERRVREEAVFEDRQESAQETWKSFLCFDVEATCRGGREYDWPNEVIVGYLPFSSYFSLGRRARMMKR